MLYLALILFSGLIFGRAVKYLKLPNVTGYLIAGLLIGPHILKMFFVVSGAELDITILPSIGLIGVIYVVLRVIGKVAGASIGSFIMQAPETVKKYLGLTLVPQAGVAIGLSLIASQAVPEFGETIRAVILCGTLIYELIGPALTKLGLKKAGEITE